MIYLGPLFGYHKMFNEYNLFFHLINPLLGIFVYLFGFELLEIKKCYLVVIPIIIYGILYGIMVFSRHWKDFYSFTFGYKWYLFVLSMLVMTIFTLSLILGIYFLKKLINGGKKNG